MSSLEWNTNESSQKDGRHKRISGLLMYSELNRISTNQPNRK